MSASFDHRDPGTPESQWSLAGVPTLSAPVTGDRIVLVAAHPDDETLGAGGLIARCASADVELIVIVASDGSRSHPDSATHDPTRLAHVRRTEVRAAVDELGAGVSVDFLDLPDGRLDACRADLRDAISARATHATHLVSPWTGDRHPDHEVCGRVALEIARSVAAQVWQYPIWLWHWGRPGTRDVPDGLTAFALTADERQRKAAALDCHLSQHAPLSNEPGDEAILPATMLAHFHRPCEYFVVTDDVSPTAGA